MAVGAKVTDKELDATVLDKRRTCLHDEGEGFVARERAEGVELFGLEVDHPEEELIILEEEISSPSEAVDFIFAVRFDSEGSDRLESDIERVEWRDRMESSTEEGVELR